MKRYLSNSVVIVTLLIIAGCGFHLRGAVNLPESIKTMYVQGLNLQRGVGLTLKRHLTSNGIVIVEDYQKGNAVLDILENKYERRVLSVGSSAKVSEYELYGRITFKVTDGSGAVLAEEQSVEAQKDYQFNQDEVLGSGEEESVLREDLEQRLVRSIMRRLEAIK